MAKAPARLATLLALCLVGLGGCRHAGAPHRAVSGLRLTSGSFEGTIPVKYASCGQGANISPELEWSTPPAGTRSFVLTMHDPDAPRGDFAHWIVFNLPPEQRELPEGMAELTLPGGAREGENGFGRVGYSGPCPPPHQVHRYLFEIYALDTRLNLPEGASPAELLAAMRGHVLAHGGLIARFGL
jgi:Raf kinase inhibitor-like YbhB/YbcL family protein